MTEVHSKRSILLLDDDPHLVQAYGELLSSDGTLQVIGEVDAARARDLAMSQLFDAVVIDAKLQYRGAHFGGLWLADELRPRYGANSLLIVSQYIDAETMHRYGHSHRYLSKSSRSSLILFIEELKQELVAMRQQQFAFVAMQYRPETRALYEERIKKVVEGEGFRCFSAEEVHHNHSLRGTMFDLIRGCKFVAFIADGANPNAYYEAGFAAALGKEVLVLARSSAEVEFNLQDSSVISTYDTDEGLETLLSQRIQTMRLSPVPGR